MGLKNPNGVLQMLATKVRSRRAHFHVNYDPMRRRITAAYNLIAHSLAKVQ